MLAHKHITKIVAVLMALAAALCLAASAFAGQIAAAAGDTGVTMAYESALFDTDTVLTVNILMDEADWQAMLDNAAAEEYYACDVEINGKTFYNVGVRPKGNTSLTSIASDPTTDRYSLKLEFDHYVKGQTCYGLDKLILNNNYADATNMKEALIYDMFRFLGADASLYNYAKISVNGEYWGVYLALEAVEDSFLLRNYGAKRGELYKPDSMNIGGGEEKQALQGDMPKMPQGNFGAFPARGEAADDAASDGFSPSGGAPQMPEGFDPSQFSAFSQETEGQKENENRFARGGGFGGFAGFGSGGANLNYIDDELDSYSTIWEGEVTSSGKKDHQRVVTALKHIAGGTALEEYMDIDNLLRYMAVHIFSVNEDSLSGSMAHNYYLYEADGRLNLIPWDYNLALGGMSGGDASQVVNSAIDDAFDSTNFFDTLMENETYKAQYHAYLSQLVEEYIDGGGFDAFYQRTRNLLDTLVESDPTAFYSFEEYETAAEMLYKTVKLRGASIAAQVAGEIPSAENARSSGDSLIDASEINLRVMGVMNGGGNRDFRSFFTEQKNETNTQETPAAQPAAEVLETGGQSGDMPQPPSGMNDGMGPSAGGQSGDMPQPPSGMNDGMGPSAGGQSASASPQPADENANANEEAAETVAPETMQRRTPFQGMAEQTTNASPAAKNLISLGLCTLLLLAALVFALCYKRR